MTRIAVVYQSQHGHTKLLADAILKRLRSVDDVTAEIFEIRART